MGWEGGVSIPAPNPWKAQTSRRTYRWRVQRGPVLPGGSPIWGIQLRVSTWFVNYTYYLDWSFNLINCVFSNSRSLMEKLGIVTYTYLIYLHKSVYQS